MVRHDSIFLYGVAVHRWLIMLDRILFACLLMVLINIFGFMYERGVRWSMFFVVRQLCLIKYLRIGSEVLWMRAMWSGKFRERS
ncbi:MAG: hypothetical protein Harvfovirus23_7 [Harvfovirus sp.]|uniref:Uncharacterized protein n=1 Tax=Harvfovirus sp. TaxID=2487768 RepID=A0A3G5A233_9VIRU|nr:MAG: hypothetical protein Harvfovirus23_7 [Harvfovirus sp.]